jgi:membrane associated rhomboid family serine protease
MDELPPRSPFGDSSPEGGDNAPPPRVPVFNLPAGILAALALLGVIYAAQSLILSAAAAEWLAAVHAGVNWGQPTILIGASGVVSALMGSACRFAFGSSGRSIAHYTGFQPARLSIGEALSLRTVRVFIIVWFLGNIAIALGLPLFGDLAGTIAWDAHIGGFLFGFLLFGLFDPVPAGNRSF